MEFGDDRIITFDTEEAQRNEVKSRFLATADRSDGASALFKQLAIFVAAARFAVKFKTAGCGAALDRC
jgi:hypothetical protein